MFSYSLRMIINVSDILQKLPKATISDIAGMIHQDYIQQRKKLPFSAIPYVDAMLSLNSLSDSYGADSGEMIVAYALGNLQTWRGDIARAVKKELNKRLK
jgi:hypothetical protein